MRLELSQWKQREGLSHVFCDDVLVCCSDVFNPCRTSMMLGMFLIMTAVACAVAQEAEEPVSYTASALLTCHDY